MSKYPALRVGGLTVLYDQAGEWASTYLDATSNRSSGEPYAYPAYDSYNAEQNDPDRIADADLLAPALLNVPISIRTYYALQAARDDLERALPPQKTPALADSSEEQVRAFVKPIYALLEDPETRPFGVQTTLLSKIVHRKRPRFLVLHDKWVRTCYRNVPGAPVPPGDRSSSDYMVAISLAIRHDLTSQRDAWQGLLTASSRTDQPPITLLRLLDIIAWNAGQHPSRFM